MTTKQFMENSLFLLTVRTLSKFITVIVIAILARSLGVADFGLYGTMITLASFAGIISDWGLIIPSIRTVSQNETGIAPIANEINDAWIFWSLSASAIIVITGMMMSLPAMGVILLAISAVFEVKSTNLIRLTEGKSTFTAISWFYVIERCVFAASVLIPLSVTGSIEGISLGYIIGYSLLITATYTYFVRSYGPVRFSMQRSKIIRFTIVGAPFTVIYLFSTMYFKADLLIINLINGSESAGIYNAVVRVFEAQAFIPLTFLATTFPALSGHYRKSEQLFKKEFIKALWIFSILGGILTTGLYYFSDDIIVLLFSARFNASIELLRTLSIVFIFYYINSLLGYVLFAISREKVYAGVIISAAVVNVAGNIVLLPFYGVQTSIYIRIACEAAMMVVMTVILFRTNFFYRTV